MKEKVKQDDKTDFHESFWDLTIDPLAYQLSQIILYAAQDSEKQEFRMSKILQIDKPYIMLTFLRRFGCPVCRAVSTGLSFVYDNYLDKNKVQFIAISLDDTGYEEFERRKYFSGQIYVNRDALGFELLSLKKLGVSNGFGVTQMRRMRAAVALASANEFRNTMDFHGNLVQLGGICILDTRKKQIIYQFREEYAGDTPFVWKILEILKADEKFLKEYKDEKKDIKILQLAQQSILDQRRRLNS